MNISQQQAQDLLNQAEAVSKPNAKSIYLQAAIIFLGSASFIPGFIGAGAIFITGNASYLLIGLCITAILIVSTIWLSMSKAKRFAKQFNRFYTVAVLVNALVYTVYIIMINNIDLDWSGLWYRMALLFIAPFIATTSFLSYASNASNASNKKAK